MKRWIISVVAAVLIVIIVCLWLWAAITINPVILFAPICLIGAILFVYVIHELLYG